VLLAGLGDTAQQYGGLAPRLVARHRVLGLTRRGHGRSDRPDAGYDLDTFAADILRMLDTFEIEQAILVGHSFGGLEIPRFATRAPGRAAAVIYLDALFPKLDPEPDLSGNPVWDAIPAGDPQPEDLVSRVAYLAYIKRARPAWARIWCAALEADALERVTIGTDGQLTYRHDDGLMDRIYMTVWPVRDPEYAQVQAPALAIVPDGDFHPSVPLDASDVLRVAADRYWQETLRPWIRRRTAVFRRMVPTARVIELDTPHHHIFHAREDETVRAILDFLAA
jgi:pimeloyl-ACP methyl ester carboxylesterase